MRILITGGTGFIGSNLANRLTDDGHEVIVIGTKTEQKPKAAKYIDLSLIGLTSYSFRKMGKIDVCFHQAANNDTLDTDEDNMMFANFGAPVTFLDMVMKYSKCSKIVYASSSAVYGNSQAPYVEGTTPELPLNAYGRSKLEFDGWAKLVGQNDPEISIIGLRYTNVYGESEGHKGKRASMIYQLSKTMMRGESPKLFRDGNQLRDWVYVKDVINANLKAMEYPGSGIFNCGSGRSVTFNKLIEIINKKLDRDIQPNWIDCPFQSAYQNHTEADMTRAKYILKFTPEYDVESGIPEMIDGLSKQPV